MLLIHEDKKLKTHQITMPIKLAAFFIPATFFAPQAMAAISITDECKNSTANSLTEMFTCGSVSGNLRSLYYSTHNAYFVPGLSQDTISYGGSLNYTTADYYGFSLGTSAILQRGIDHDNDHLVSELGPNQTAVGEAYLRWRDEDFSITAGNQRINLPFVGDYDWRITPILFRGIDMNYGDSENFLHATRITRYKSWGDEHFHKTTAYDEAEGKTNGMWAIGGGRSLNINDKKLIGQLWYENYDEYTKLFYSDGFLSWLNSDRQPKLGAQFIRGVSEGKALAGEVNSTSYGIQFSMNIISTLAWSLNYDHIAASGSSYGNGSLVTPYAHNTASGPYFAQPFFTSTQDLGSGNAYSTDLNWQAGEQLSLGSRYSFMDLTPVAGAGSRNQSEYLVYGTWRFGGILKGFSISDFAGVQTASNSDKNFWQNRLALEYAF